MRVMPALKRLLQPKVSLPLILAGALFYVAVRMGNLGQVTGRVKQMPLRDIAPALGFAAIYLALKGAQLHLLLRNLGAHPGWRRFLLAFAVGELALTLPLGIFAQNWVLSDRNHIHFGRSSAATVVMLVMETAIVLLWLAVSGIPGWSPLRPAAAAVLGGLLLGMFAVLRFRSVLERLAGRNHPRWFRKVLQQAVGLVRGLGHLASLRMLALNALLSPAYLGALVAAFMLVGHGMGLPGLSFAQAATIYAFSLVAILLTGGLSGQVGTVEVIGMSAARAFGLEYTDGLALMLGFRLVWTGSIWLLSGPVAFTLRHAMGEQDARGDE